MKNQIEIARQKVADRHDQAYHKRAILNGEWDTGTLVRAELELLMNENKVENEDAKAA